MKILLKKDRRTIEFVDGIDKLNANDVMVNTLEVEFESPLLHGETLWVTFEKEDQHLETTKPILATNEYKVTIPASVIKVPGEWSLQLFIKRYDAVSKNLVSRQASIKVTFTVENGLYVDDEMDLANNGSLASLYSIADKNTQELPLTLQHLMDFTNQPFYASDGSLTVEKEGITYRDLMAKLKGDADTLTLADVVTTWKREAFNRDARVGDEFFGTARTKDDYIVGLNCEVIKVDESEERKGRPYWGVTDVEIIRYPDKEIALVANITLEFSKTYAEIVELTNAGADVDSFPVDGLNRRPNIGERFFAVCTSGDKYGFGMTAEVVGFSTSAEGREFAVFKCIEVVLLAGSTIPKQVRELERRMAKIDGGAGGEEGEEGEEDPTAIIPLVLNNSVSLGDIRVQVNAVFSVDLGQFNRKPSKNEYFLAIAYDVNGNAYAIRAIAQMPGQTSVRCQIAKVTILHDEDRLDSAVDKAGDTMTGDLNVAKGASKSTVAHDRIGVYRNVSEENSDLYSSVELRLGYLHEVVDGPLHQNRRINLPAVRYNVSDEAGSIPEALDETLVARSEIDPLEAKLDTVEEIAKGAQIAESFTSYEEMVNTLRGELLGSSDGLTELKYKKGQSIYIETVDVPDLWVSRVEENNFNPYLYTTDEAIVSALATNGYIQVGHYRLAQLENGKVNIANLVKKDDFDKEFKRAATTNTETWTDNEKAAACNTIGAVKQYIPTANNTNFVYTARKDGSGNVIQGVYRISGSAMADVIPITGAGGSLPCGVPPNGLQSYHATPRDWVENMPDKTTLTDEQKEKWQQMIGVSAGGGSSGGTKYKHAIGGVNYPDAMLSNLTVVSSRSTPYTNLSEIVADFETGAVVTVATSGGLGRRICNEVHPYGGFYFYNGTSMQVISPVDNTGWTVTDSVTEKEE